MPFVYSLSLLAQNHYMLKPAKQTVSLSANHTNRVTIYKYKTAPLMELSVFIIYQSHKSETTTCSHESGFMT